jgi:hypothetical protein
VIDESRITSKPVSNENQEPLTDEERRLFEEHQEFITLARLRGPEVGKRLAEIRDRQLYRERFRTFAGFCRTRYRLSCRRAQELIGQTHEH